MCQNATSMIEHPEWTIEYLNILVNYLIQVIWIEFVGGSTLLFDVHPHLLQLFENEFYTLSTVMLCPIRP